MILWRFSQFAFFGELILSRDFLFSLAHGQVEVTLVSRSRTLSYTSGGGGRESGKVPYIELSQRLV